jgi:hypothetical protein
MFSQEPIADFETWSYCDPHLPDKFIENFNFPLPQNPALFICKSIPSQGTELLVMLPWTHSLLCPWDTTWLWRVRVGPNGAPPDVLLRDLPECDKMVISWPLGTNSSVCTTETTSSHRLGPRANVCLIGCQQYSYLAGKKCSSPSRWSMQRLKCD